MKKFNYIIVLLLFMVFVLPINTFAADVMELIPVGTNTSVNTKLFQYDFVANTNGITFSNIKNNSNNKVPVSINILLFDTEKKNIGYLTYCSDKDLSSDYSGFKLNAAANSSFYINISSKYFVEGKTNSDIKYIAVQDENKYCEIGGYSKYNGLTLKEINDGGVIASDGVKSKMLSSVLKNNLVMIISIALFISIGFLFIIGLFINSLHRKIYNRGSILAFLPIANIYLCVKLSFGSTVGIIYIIGVVCSLFVSRIIPLFSSVVGLLGGLSFCVVIIKLVTKNYFLFIGNEPDSVKSLKNKKIIVKQEKVVPTVQDVVAENKEESLDLSYGNTYNVNKTNSAVDDMFNFNGNIDNNVNNSNNTFINTNQSSTNTTNNNKEEESDLSKFFQ